MKKLSALLLAIIMCLSTMSCSSSDDDSTVTDNNTNTPDEAPDEAPDESPDENVKKEISRGNVWHVVYTNYFLDFRFLLPDSWDFVSEDTLAMMAGLTSDEISKENFKYTLENKKTVYDMIAIDSETDTSIVAGYDNLSKMGISSSSFTVQQYLDRVKNQMVSSGIPVVFGSIKTVTLGETEFFKATGVIETERKSTTVVYYLKKIDNYMCYMGVTIPEGYTVEEIEDMFEVIS